MTMADESRKKKGNTVAWVIGAGVAIYVLYQLWKSQQPPEAPLSSGSSSTPLVHVVPVPGGMATTTAQPDTSSTAQSAITLEEANYLRVIYAAHAMGSPKNKKRTIACTI